MKTYFYLPSIEKISGGVAVISQLGKSLISLGYDVGFVTKETLPAEFNLSMVETYQFETVTIQPEDRWIVPEGWPNALLPGIRAKAKCAVYVQNWAYLLGLLTDGVEWHSLPVRMIAVSKPVAKFIKDTLGFTAPVIRPAIDQKIFYPNEGNRKDITKLRIAWMPRKNKNLGKQIKIIFESSLKLKGHPLPRWFTIENCSVNKVAEIMRSVDIFLATGFPEGFALPPLEAMACGCLVVGFTGMGGWDYMRQAWADGFIPALELDKLAWGSNGFFASDGDVWGAAIALEQAYKMFLSGQAKEIIEQGLKTARHFTYEKQKHEISRIWNDTSFWD